MNKFNENSLKLKAAIEFGSEYVYTIRNGGLGPTLFVDAKTQERARPARKKIPSQWEGLRVIIIYSTAPPEDEISYDTVRAPAILDT